MALIINLRHLDGQDLHLEGEIPAEELDLGEIDELMRPASGLKYDIEVERHERGLLLQGRLSLSLECECARCLGPFRHELTLPDWCTLLAWEGEEAVRVRNDCVDLTPYLREDMVLALPQRPLCKAECGGLQVQSADDPGLTRETRAEEASPAWAMLNNLKL
jgi:uncharacterized protein